jgi:hypothetical protein
MDPDLRKLTQGKADLINVLDEALHLLAFPGNEFMWSFWSEADEAIAEVAQHRQRISGDDFSHLMDLEVLFAVSGPLQEVSLSSGWGPIFVDLGDKFDRAIALIKPQL